MELRTSQAELRRAYVLGGPGAIVSGLVWLAAGLTAVNSTVANGFYVLFFGGMAIFPISKLIVQFFFRRKPESKGNPGGMLVVETVFPMIGGLFAAWLLLPYRPEFVFSVSAIAVGAHYFGFRTAYGVWTYWVFGGILCAVGLGSIFFNTPDGPAVPFVISAIEFAFGCWFILVDRREANSSAR